MFFPPLQLITKLDITTHRNVNNSTVLVMLMKPILSLEMYDVCIQRCSQFKLTVDAYIRIQKVECTSMMLRPIIRNKTLKEVVSCTTVFLTNWLCFFVFLLLPYFCWSFQDSLLWKMH